MTETCCFRERERDEKVGSMLERDKKRWISCLIKAGLRSAGLLDMAGQAEAEGLHVLIGVAGV